MYGSQLLEILTEHNYDILIYIKTRLQSLGENIVGSFPPRSCLELTKRIIIILHCDTVIGLKTKRSCA